MCANSHRVATRGQVPPGLAARRGIAPRLRKDGAPTQHATPGTRSLGLDGTAGMGAREHRHCRSPGQARLDAMPL
jgi:hypothetical protein